MTTSSTPSATTNMKTGIELIAEERQRQIEIEKWDEAHDEDHTAMQLSSAAGCYIASAHKKYFDRETHGNESGKYSRFQVYDEDYPQRPKWVDGWPWNDEFDKREKHDVLRSLVIAGALIAAEIDRLQNS